MKYNKYVKTHEDLMTTHEETRAGFLAIALEKNRVGDPYVKQALAFRTIVSETEKPEDFIEMPNIRPFLLTAAGLSEKSLQHLNEEDHKVVIKELIEKFLKPAGKDYIDETIYRFLLTKGDAVGGSMRNRIGSMGEEKLVRCLLSCMKVQGCDYKWVDKEQKRVTWKNAPNDDLDLEKRIKAISWNNANGSRCLGFNMNISVVKKNVDICLFNADTIQYDAGKIAKENPQKAIMLGELKGGIYPAGADEHWKTANTALERIRTGYKASGNTIMTSFVGAAIERAMSEEIYNQLEDGVLTNAANLTNNEQLVEYCNWIINL